MVDQNIPVSDEVEFDEDRPPSKSQRKRDMTRLQKLSGELASLKPSAIAHLNLPESFIDSIAQASKLKSSNARNRQLRHAAKILEDQEDLVDQIHQYFDDQETHAERQSQHHKVIERWRDRLVDANQDALSDFFDAFPNTNRQELSTLVRNARKEKALEKQATQQRKLFVYLRDHAC